MTRVANNLFNQFFLMRKQISFYLLLEQYPSSVWSSSQGNLHLMMFSNLNFLKLLVTVTANSNVIMLIFTVPLNLPILYSKGKINMLLLLGWFDSKLINKYILNHRPLNYWVIGLLCGHSQFSIHIYSEIYICIYNIYEYIANTYICICMYINIFIVGISKC